MHMIHSVTAFFAVGCFAVGHFAVGQFAVRTIRRRDLHACKTLKRLLLNMPLTLTCSE